jgi:hypothetical protein
MVDCQRPLARIGKTLHYNMGISALYAGGGGGG